MHVDSDNLFSFVESGISTIPDDTSVTSIAEAHANPNAQVGVALGCVSVFCNFDKADPLPATIASLLLSLS